jgi:hypothetical protein
MVILSMMRFHMCGAVPQELILLSLTVNGSAVLITTNLRDTLRALRNKGVLTLLWIDALCINQKDKKERVTQVKMMADLYKNAANVSTWLGDANEIEVWDNLTEFLQDFTTLVDEDSLLYQPFYRTHGAMDSISFDDGINEMMGGDWFTRIWVVQEAASAQQTTLHFGPWSCNWKAGDQTVRLLRRLKFISICPFWEIIKHSTSAGSSRIRYSASKWYASLITLLELSVLQTMGGRTPPDIRDLLYDTRGRTPQIPEIRFMA